MLDRCHFSQIRLSPSMRAGALLLLLTCVSPAGAGVQIRGSGDALRVEVTKAPITEVLAALGPVFHVRYRTDVPLEGEVDGIYRGSLSRVIARVLKGYNYVVKRDGKSIEVMIIEKQPQIDPDADPRARYGIRRTRPRMIMRR